MVEMIWGSWTFAGHLVLGLFAGVASGLLGIGGGQILIPGMVFLFGYDQKLAQGVSLAFIVPTALAGSYTHAQRGNVLARVGLLLVPGALVGGLVGAGLAQLLDARVLKLGFGVFLLYASIRMIAPGFYSRAWRTLTRQG